MRHLIFIWVFAIWTCIEATSSGSSNEENCIKLTTEKEKAINRAIDKITQYLSDIQEELDGIDIRLIRVDIDKHSDQEREEKELNLKITINDCGGDNDEDKKSGKKRRRHRKHHSHNRDSEIKDYFDKTTVEAIAINDKTLKIEEYDIANEEIQKKHHHHHKRKQHEQISNKDRSDDGDNTNAGTEDTATTTYDEKSYVSEDATLSTTTANTNENKNIFFDRFKNFFSFAEPIFNAQTSERKSEDIISSNVKNHHHHKEKHQGTSADSSAVAITSNEDSVKTEDTDNSQYTINNDESSDKRKKHHHRKHVKDTDEKGDDNNNTSETITVRNEEEVTTFDDSKTVIESDDSNDSTKKKHHHERKHRQHGGSKREDTTIDESDVSVATVNSESETIEGVLPAKRKHKHGHHKRQHGYTDDNQFIVASGENSNVAVIEEQSNTATNDNEEITVKYEETVSDEDNKKIHKRKHHHKNKHTNNFADKDVSDRVFIVDSPDSENAFASESYAEANSHSQTTTNQDISSDEDKARPRKHHHHKKQHGSNADSNTATATSRTKIGIPQRYEELQTISNEDNEYVVKYEETESDEAYKKIHKRKHHHKNKHSTDITDKDVSDGVFIVDRNDNEKDAVVENYAEANSYSEETYNKDFSSADDKTRPRKHHHHKKHHRSNVDNSAATADTRTKIGIPQRYEDSKTDRTEDDIDDQRIIIEDGSPQRRHHHYKHHKNNNSNQGTVLYQNDEGDKYDGFIGRRHNKGRPHMHFMADEFKRFLEQNDDRYQKCVCIDDLKPNY